LGTRSNLANMVADLIRASDDAEIAEAFAGLPQRPGL
jgi:hypothetical protein